MSAESSSRDVRIIQSLVWAASLGVALLGLPVLLGHSWAALSAAPSLSVREAHTALGLLFGGLALGLLSPKATGRLRWTLGMCCAGALFLIGAATLVHHFSGLELPVPPPPFRWEHWTPGTPPDASAAGTAFCFMLIGSALLLLGRCTELSARWADLFVIPALITTLLAFNGYFHDALLLLPPHFLQQTGMGLPASAALLLLCVGLLCARPDQGLMVHITQNTLGGFLARRLVPVTLLGPPLFGALLKVLDTYGYLDTSMKIPLFATVASVSGVGLVLLSTTTLDRIDTERHRASARADHERSLLRTVVDNAPVGILFVDAQTQEVQANSAFQSLVGHPLLPGGGQRQFLGHLRHPDGRPVLAEEFPTFRGLEGQAVSPEEYVIVHPDRQFPVLSSAAPVHEDSGHVRGVVVTIQDITARRELERLREEYVGLISHDLRNPLQLITLRASLLQRKLQEKTLASEAAMAEALLQNTQQMSGMVEELLESSRLEAKQVELRREPTDILHFLEAVLDRDIAPDARERLRLEVAAPVSQVLMDAHRVERVMVNLLTNALKYSRPATPVVVRLDQSGPSVEISVRDQGAGLSPESAAHLFEKYYRTREGRTSDVMGLGLGLYISRLIIEAHGGAIRAESIQGQGTTFTFTLPRLSGFPEQEQRRVS
ncbi:ATP-binding protein [Stigmatella sp. ncwal1]|uniref:histidine kinase n=1 Tax=Stigmatella ashevillensis TaxID=2995309 RepID=A0ABT5DCR6_9BACT|nr:ATP-binding protein [Stigmatella ashevillena]MDC0711464.1 ATP-binding protein [Stigmatella ashevillena]